MSRTLFTPDQIQAAVHQELSRVPKGRDNALVAYASRGRAEFRFARRVGTHWHMGAVVKRERGVDEKYGWDGGVYVQGSW